MSTTASASAKVRKYVKNNNRITPERCSRVDLPEAVEEGRERNSNNMQIVSLDTHEKAMVQRLEANGNCHSRVARRNPQGTTTSSDTSRHDSILNNPTEENNNQV